ncbi:MAG: YkgJ family cysteine cluster protein [Planctomycetales bacterium]|nr:YkgJ family cysteine cluster protein [Planctomycetales bacterium]
MNFPATAPSAQAALSPPIRMKRDRVPKGDNLCEHCTAKCCHYFALPIDQPKGRKDFDYIRWYLLHDRATIFVEDQNWYLLVYTTCKHLRDDHRCGIYETRPQICRDYTTDECEFDDDWCYEQYFETPEQIDEYADALYGPQFPSPDQDDKDSLRSRRPSGLPVVL